MIKLGWPHGKSIGLKVRRLRLSSSSNINDSYDFKKFRQALWVRYVKYKMEGGVNIEKVLFKVDLNVTYIRNVHSVLKCWFLSLTPSLLSQNPNGKSWESSF